MKSAWKKAVFLLCTAAIMACGGNGSTINSDDDRLEIDIEGAPFYGREDAPVTIVEFMDIQCPYCSSSARMLKRLADDFNGDVKLVFRHFPIPSIHSRAIPAALAVECAEDQGKFWEMLYILVAPNANLNEQSIGEAADELELDRTVFDACRNSSGAMNRVNSDWQMGQDLEIHATPTIFVNGLRLVGLQNEMSLAALVRQELKLKAEEEEETQQSQNTPRETP